MGRGRKIVDAQRVIYLASIGHTIEEIAALCDCGKDTIYRRFAIDSRRSPAHIVAA